MFIFQTRPFSRFWNFISFIYLIYNIVAAAAKSLQSCLTLGDPRDGSPPGSPVPGIFQARTLEWVAISFSNAWKWKVKVKSLRCVRLLATSWTAAYQAPPSMGFSRQEYGWQKAYTIVILVIFIVIRTGKATPWIVACQGPLPMRILQARILGWVTVPSNLSNFLDKIILF